VTCQEGFERCPVKEDGHLVSQDMSNDGPSAVRNNWAQTYCGCVEVRQQHTAAHCGAGRSAHRTDFAACALQTL